MEKKERIKLKSPKKIDCSNCKFSCSNTFTEVLRSEICRSFWNLGDYRRQKDFILMNVKSTEPKRRRPASVKTPSENSKTRTNSKSFFLQNKRVCQSFFLKTLAISNGPLIKAFQHKNAYTNFFDGDDKRGKHTPSNKLGDDVISSVVSHVEKFTVKTGKGKRHIINDPKIKSLRQLFNIYRESNIHSLSYTSFKRIFYDYNFSLPSDRMRPKPKVKSDLVVYETHETDDHEGFSKDPSESVLAEPTAVEVLQPNVHQVPNSSKFFANSSQVYEIQFIEIPMSSIID